MTIHDLLEEEQPGDLRFGGARMASVDIEAGRGIWSPRPAYYMPGVDMLIEAGMEDVRVKSIRLSEYLLGLWRAWLAPLGFRLNSPREAAWRGSPI